MRRAVPGSVGQVLASLRRLDGVGPVACKLATGHTFVAKPLAAALNGWRRSERCADLGFEHIDQGWIGAEQVEQPEIDTRVAVSGRLDDGWHVFALMAAGMEEVRHDQHRGCSISDRSVNGSGDRRLRQLEERAPDRQSNPTSQS